MINKLIEIIGREATIFEAFLELLEQQQKMLVTNDVDGLNRITDLQREKLVESQLLNKKRQELIQQIKVANDIEGDLNVSRLLEIVDEGQADRLQRLQRVILSLNDKITETRNQNAMLLNRSREYILKTMEMLSKINSPDSTYSAPGKKTARELNVAVDRRA
ncbi:MAG: flagellar protein FlgN [Candidatus Zixiibacteriota bacterium]|nr:MAG: flagellar protein FlgN [candidate division Zixibacteria bacterium]